MPSRRLLAHAGFDARQAVRFWENRQATPKNAECSLTRAESFEQHESLQRRIMGSGHPVNEVRVERLKSELTRWEKERREALSQLSVGSKQEGS
jgi:hypothetical protein